MRKALCLALLFCLCLCTAIAEPQLVPQLSMWKENQPVDAVLSIDLRAHMPFDDERCAQLNSLLQHLSLHLQTGSGVDRVAVLVDGGEAIWLAQREGTSGPETQVSWAKDTFACNMDTLLGSTEGSITLERPRASWLEDALTFVERLAAGLEGYKKENAVNAAVKNMGTARRKMTYTIPKAEAEAFARAVKESGVEGLTFPGQQKLTLWRSEDGSLLRVDYTGQCGRDADSLRKVNLSWRLCREESCYRDEITLKTPAVKGKAYNSLTCSRHMEQNEDGTARYTLNYDYSRQDADGKSAWEGEIDLTGAPEQACTRLTGSVSLASTPAGAEAKRTLVLLPNLLVGETAGAPLVSGLVTVQEKRGKSLLEDADVSISLAAGMHLLWTEQTPIPLTPQLQESLAQGMSAALVKRLVLLPAQDTLYLSRDLPEDAWQGIVDAAQTALTKEETP